MPQLRRPKLQRQLSRGGGITLLVPTGPDPQELGFLPRSWGVIWVTLGRSFESFPNLKKKSEGGVLSPHSRVILPELTSQFYIVFYIAIWNI